MDNTQIMPNSQEAERAVLGAILIEPKSIFAVSDIITSGDFYDERNRVIYDHLQGMMDDSTRIDPIVLISDLRKSEKIEAAGGAAYVSNLREGMPRGIAVRHYARIVRDKSSLRRIVSAASDATSEAMDPAASVDSVVQRLASVLAGIDTKTGGFRPMSDIVSEGYKRLEERAQTKGMPWAIRSGLIALDSFIGGFSPGELVLVAGRTSQGKSALCANIALHAALFQGKTTGIVTLEMTQYQVYERMICATAGVDMFDLVRGLIADWGPINHASARLSSSPIWIDDVGGITIRQLQAKAERLKAEHGMDLLIVDYLGLLKGTQTKMNKVQEIGEISAGLKGLAKCLKVPVIAAVQLNRDPSKDNRPPALTDLKDSGSLEQDADMVILIHQEFFKDMDNMPRVVSTDLIVGKNRNGKTGKITVGFNRPFTSFVDAARIE